MKMLGLGSSVQDWYLPLRHVQEYHHINFYDPGTDILPRVTINSLKTPLYRSGNLAIRTKFLGLGMSVQDRYLPLRHV